MAKRAVVIIHGMGEARPMETVRGFARAFLPDLELYSKAAANKDLLDHRSLIARLKADLPGEETDLHFFELYWAHHVESPKITVVLSWIATLMFRWPHQVPVGMRGLWGVVWLLVAVLLFTFGRQIATRGVNPLNWPEVTNVGWLGLLLWLGAAGWLYFMTNFLGDAYRYFVSSPGNVRMRQNIRQVGLDLLRDLNENREFERIIVVGHSLGSVVGFDLLRLLWDEYNARVRYLSEGALQSLRQITDLEPSLPDQLPQLKELQFQLNQEQRQLGSRWRITDFITLGSPLAHADMFLSNTRAGLQERIGEREVPVCPPLSDKSTNTFAYSTERDGDKFWILHHAAVFGLTRWTNLYVPATWGLFGDFVGGPLAPLFGKGLCDIPVRGDGWQQHTLLAHNQYWMLGSPALATVRSIVLEKEKREEA